MWLEFQLKWTFNVQCIRNEKKKLELWNYNNNRYHYLDRVFLTHSQTFLKRIVLIPLTWRGMAWVSNETRDETIVRKGRHDVLRSCMIIRSGSNTTHVQIVSHKISACLSRYSSHWEKFSKKSSKWNFFLLIMIGFHFVVFSVLIGSSLHFVQFHFLDLLYQSFGIIQNSILFCQLFCFPRVHECLDLNDVCYCYLCSAERFQSHLKGINPLMHIYFLLSWAFFYAYLTSTLKKYS